MHSITADYGEVFEKSLKRIIADTKRLVFTPRWASMGDELALPTMLTIKCHRSSLRRATIALVQRARSEISISFVVT